MLGRPDFNLQFRDPDLPARLEAMSPGALDALPFGVVLLDQRDRIVLSNSVERERSGRGKEVVGRHFFKEFAPQFENSALQSYVRAVRDNRDGAERRTAPLDLDGLVDAMAGQVRIRVDSASSGGLWIVLDGRVGVSAAEDAPPRPASARPADPSTE